MPQLDLDVTQAAIVQARMESDDRLRKEKEKFERFASRRMERIDREINANKAKMIRALSQSLGVPVPPNALPGMRADGTGVLVWPDPPAPPAKKPENSTGGTLGPKLMDKGDDDRRDHTDPRENDPAVNFEKPSEAPTNGVLEKATS